MLVLRHEDEGKAMKAAKRAEIIADNPSSWYDYWAIPRYILLRLIWYKLTRRRFGFGYLHNSHFICSELVDEAYDFIIPKPPLPQDFLTVPELHPVWEGTYGR